MEFFKPLEQFIAKLNPDAVPMERKTQLTPLIEFIQKKLDENKSIKLIFICTHNSRRSMFTQVWAQTLAQHFKLLQFQSYSGGTESTALFPLVAKTLTDTGFQISTISQGENPVYAIKYASKEPAVIGFSKTYDNSFNPSSEFAAIMTCAQADGDCPFVAGAEKRISLPYIDPKTHDNSPQAAEKYMESMSQIATELFYVFSQINT